MRRSTSGLMTLVIITILLFSALPVSAATRKPTLRARPVATKEAVGWDTVPSILARIKPPKFASRDFLITNYGAAPGTDSTEAIRQAIAACNTAGGGRVVIPTGVWDTGAIHLKSNVNLHLSDGATLKFSADPVKYLPMVFTRFEGTELMNYSPLIYAFEQENIAVTGNGTLDGSASDENWWGWARRRGTEPTRQANDVRQLRDMGNSNVPVKDRVFGPGHFLRPSFIQPYRSKNILSKG